MVSLGTVASAKVNRLEWAREQRAALAEREAQASREAVQAVVRETFAHVRIVHGGHSAMADRHVQDALTVAHAVQRDIVARERATAVQDSRRLFHGLALAYRDREAIVRDGEVTCDADTRKVWHLSQREQAPFASLRTRRDKHAKRVRPMGKHGGPLRTTDSLRAIGRYDAAVLAALLSTVESEADWGLDFTVIAGASAPVRDIPPIDPSLPYPCLCDGMCDVAGACVETFGCNTCADPSFVNLANADRAQWRDYYAEQFPGRAPKRARRTREATGPVAMRAADVRKTAHSLGIDSDAPIVE